MLWLVRQTALRAPRRLLLAAVAVALPVATLGATALFVGDSVQAMTAVALKPQQVEMRALATSLRVDPARMTTALRTVPGVRGVDVFGAVDVVVAAPGTADRVTARLFAVDRSYFAHHRWVHADGDVGRGALLDGALASAPGFAQAAAVSVELRGDAPPLGLSLPVAGRVDVRQARTWFAIPAGGVQGDLAVVPRAIVVDFASFERAVLPVLRSFGGTSAALNPGLTELPPSSLEAHVAVDHRAYPADPARAAAWSVSLRRVLERRTPGEIVVADNASEPLVEAAADATNAKILFLLLGIPGVLVAGALGLAAASALADAHRREDALLRLRGATDAQLVRLAIAQGLLAGGVGTLLGLAAALASVSAVIGHAVWRGAPPTSLLISALLAATAGGITTAARLVPLVRAGRRAALALERRHVAGRWLPTWRRSRLDVVAVVVGLTILAGNVVVGGLKPAPVPGQALALSFYVLLAPIALWVGASLLVVRGLLAALSRASRPEDARPLSSWRSTAIRWMGRRPARTSVALVLGVLAVAFGSQVLTFVATYRTARHVDARAAFGSDLRLTPASATAGALPELGPDVQSTTPIRSIPARAGTDRKTILAVDPESYPAAASLPPQIVRGRGLDALRRTEAGALVSQELAKDLAVRVGDTMPVIVFPDDLDLSQQLNLRVVGVYRAFPPTDPLSEMVIAAETVPTPRPAPDFYLAHLAGGRPSHAVAARLRRDVLGNDFSVATISQRVELQQRGLTALNLDGLSAIETAAAGLIAALGVGVLGAFLVLERGREFAVLRTLGANTRQVLTGPALEGAVAIVGSVAIGVPLGLGLGVLAVRVLALFFALPPPLLTVPTRGLLVLSATVLVLATASLGVALSRVSRVAVGVVLREP